MRYAIVALSIFISFIGFYAMSRWFSNTQWAIYGTTLVFAQLAKELFQMKLEKVLAREARRELYDIVLNVQIVTLVVIVIAFFAGSGLGQRFFVALAAAAVGICMSIIAIVDFHLVHRRAKTYFLWKLYLPSAIILSSFLFAHSEMSNDQNVMVYAAVISYCSSIAITLLITGLRLHYRTHLRTYLYILRNGLDIIKHDYLVVLMNVGLNAIAIGVLSRIMNAEIMGDFFKVQRGLALISNNIRSVTRAIYMKYWHTTELSAYQSVVGSSRIIVGLGIFLATLLHSTFFSFLNIDAKNTRIIEVVFWLLAADFVLKFWMLRSTVHLTMRRELKVVSFITAIAFGVRLAYVELPHLLGFWEASNGILILLAFPIGSLIIAIYLRRFSRHA